MNNRQPQRHRFGTATLVVGAVALLLGGGSQPGIAAPAVPPGGGQKTIGFVCAFFANAFCETILRGEREEAAKLHANVRIVFEAPTQDTAEYQVPILSAMLASHPDAVITDVTNPSEEIPALKRFGRAGIPVIEVDTAVADPSVVDSFIGTHVVLGGELAGKAIGEHLGGHGMVGIVDLAPGNVTTNKRAQGCIAYLRKHYPGIKILAVQYAGTNDPLAAERDAASMLVAHPGISAFFGTTGLLASGIGRAVINAGKKGKVFVQSFDAPPEVVKLLKQGVISSTEVQEPLIMGRLAMRYALDEIAGNKTAVPKHVLLPTITATTASANDPKIAMYYYIPTAAGKK